MITFTIYATAYYFKYNANVSTRAVTGTLGNTVPILLRMVYTRTLTVQQHM
jgi:hypothetical protein